MKSIIKFVGEKFGKITVLEYLGNKMVKYRCDCGVEKECFFYDIKRGKTTTCGCWKQSEENKERCKKKIEKLNKEGKMNPEGKNTDENTPFRYILKLLNCTSNRKRTRKPNFLSISDLKFQWEKQNGICPYSKMKLILPVHGIKADKKLPSYMYASLDRIDSSLPYTVDNVQFISRSLNYAKNTMSHDEFEAFLVILVKNRIENDGGGEKN